MLRDCQAGCPICPSLHLVWPVHWVCALAVTARLLLLYSTVQAVCSHLLCHPAVSSPFAQGDILESCELMVK
jgi:hypothetical protein